MIITSRKDIKTIGIWTLQRREFGNGQYDYDYVIKSEVESAVRFHIKTRADFDAGRVVFTVKCSVNSHPMDLEEAAEFIEYLQEALVVASEFQQAIDSAEED